MIICAQCASRALCCCCASRVTIGAHTTKSPNIGNGSGVTAEKGKDSTLVAPDFPLYRRFSSALSCSATTLILSSTGSSLLPKADFTQRFIEASLGISSEVSARWISIEIGIFKVKSFLFRRRHRRQQYSGR